MRILIDITHPAQVHLFHHFADRMKDRGHKLFFTTRKKEVAEDLLKAFNLDYSCFGNRYRSKFGKIWGLAKYVTMLYMTALKFKPDLFLSMGSIYAAHTAFLYRKPHIALEDTGNMEQIKLYMPVTEYVLTPISYHRDHGLKQIRYHGTHELAFIHPSHFKPDPAVLDILGVDENTPFVILRFVSWQATHDSGQSGILDKHKPQLIQELSKHAKVFISSEADLPPEYEPYRIKIPPHMMHDALYYSSLYIGEGASMASECGCMGTPAFYVNSIYSSYCDDLEKGYGLIWNYRSSEGVLEKALDVVTNPKSKAEFRQKVQKLYADKIDVTAFLVWFIENYPASGQIMTKDPDYQLRFK